MNIYILYLQNFIDSEETLKFFEENIEGTNTKCTKLMMLR